MEKKNSNPTNLHIIKKEIGVFKVTISSELIDYFKYIQATNFIFLLVLLFLLAILLFAIAFILIFVDNVLIFVGNV